MAAAAVVAASCSKKVSNVTKITGSFAGDVPEAVSIKSDKGTIDTSATVTDGKFTIEVPTCKTEMSVITAGNVSAHFIADGTPLNVVFDKTNATFTSKYPEISSETFYSDYASAAKKLNDEYSKAYAGVKNAGDEAIDALANKFQAKFDSLGKALLSKDNGSIASLMALNDLQYSLPAEQMDSLLNSLDASLQENEAVAKMKKVTASKLATAEGQKFADFDVNGVKLSDYVGKGKYVLVDFWAAWCGPCKAEIPNIKNVYDKYHGDNFDVVSVAVWDRPGYNTADTAKAYGVNWNQIVGGNTLPAETYGIQYIPHIILFGPDGTILKRDLRGEDIEKAIAEHVQPVK